MGLWDAAVARMAFNAVAPADFRVSFFVPRTVLLVYRVLAFLFLLAVAASWFAGAQGGQSVIDTPKLRAERYFLWLTNHTYVLLMLHFFLALLLSWLSRNDAESDDDVRRDILSLGKPRRVLRYRSDVERADGRAGEPLPAPRNALSTHTERLALAAVLVWGLAAMLAFFVTILFWGLLADSVPFLYYISPISHGVNVLLVLVDLFLGSLPIVPGHVLFTALFMVLTTLFWWIVFWVGGYFPYGGITDFRNYSTVVVYVVVTVFTALLWFTLVYLARLRDWIARRWFLPSVESPNRSDSATSSAEEEEELSVSGFGVAWTVPASESYSASGSDSSESGTDLAPNRGSFSDEIS
jgi:hypothetical protein